MALFVLELVERLSDLSYSCKTNRSGPEYCDINGKHNQQFFTIWATGAEVTFGSQKRGRHSVGGDGSVY